MKDLEEYEAHLVRKQRLIENIKQIKAKYDQQHLENKNKLNQLKEIRHELNNIKIRKDEKN